MTAAKAQPQTVRKAGQLTTRSSISDTGQIIIIHWVYLSVDHLTDGLFALTASNLLRVTGDN